MFDLDIKKACRISKREKQVLVLIAEGLTCDEIGYQLNISTTTVISHRNNMKQKLGVKNSCELVFSACKSKLI
ncbi:MAG: helix-turn-helix transcriptional regulator [Bacteroidales bacterium]|nr:helix-turn-helix transcriptional regulator [Bacteroidales bacterium]